MMFAARLRETRIRAGLGARELDRLAGRPEGQASLVETRGTNVRVETATAYADALGVTLDWLVDGRGPEPTADQIRSAVAAARARGPLPRTKTSGKHPRPVRRTGPAAQEAQPRSTTRRRPAARKRAAG
jgi:transcriptional regulator with XRE-family HTH domain